MSYTIALAGNPNSGKTSLFNLFTGSAQYVGNWPGVTVDRKEGKLKGHKDVVVQDLPGIYSLSPYTTEEIIARDYLVMSSPNAVVNIVDASNIERNLYLTTQLLELGLPMLVALNMIDVVRKNNDQIDLKKLAKALGCEVVETSAVKNIGLDEVAAKAAQLAQEGPRCPVPSIFVGAVEHAIAHIEEQLEGKVEERLVRWYAIKLFERDAKIQERLKLDADTMAHIEAHIKECESALDDDSESIIINQRYAFVSRIIDQSVVKGRAKGSLSASDKIDRIVTNRILALPIFIAVMVLVYYVAVTTVGTLATDWTNDTLFGEIVIPSVASWMEGLSVAPWLSGLVVDGIISGVGAVLGFVPQMVILFLMLSILEDIGYMTRVAFIMDRIFRKFGLSGKSFIPMLIGSGCSVPGIMASRTIEKQRDRRMTIMTTSFIPCGAKLPIIALLAGTIFGGAWWVSPSAYFVGVAAVIVSGIILKKTKRFNGEPSPFVMELPAYHWPTPMNVLRSTWERAWSFIKRAGTVILLASIFIWFLSSYGFVEGALTAVEEQDQSILAVVGQAIAGIFAPLGFGTWQMAVATIMGLVAKEEVVGTVGVLFGLSGDALALVEEGAFEELAGLSGHLTALQGYSFLLFNLLCAPCFAAIGAIRREMADGKWTLYALGYLTAFAYAISLIVYQLGLLFTGGGFTLWSGVALVVLALLLYLLFRPNPYNDEGELKRLQLAKERGEA